MYEKFFGLSRKPFELTPDPEFMYLAQRHASALSMLEYGLFNHDGFTVITGDVGCGKTTVIRYLREKIEERATVGIVSNTHEALGNIMQWAMMAFGLDYRKPTLTELYATFAQFVSDEAERGRRVVLIVDEAQNLGETNMEVLRILSNISSHGNHVLHVALVGQPELRRLLRQPNMRQVRQRIAVAFHLQPLTEVETSHYMSHRLELCGGTLGLFEAGAASLIHIYSGGIPRLINVICDAALVYAFAEHKHTVTLDIVRQVISDRKASGLMPIMKPRNEPSPEPA
jgi:type II secretory pathway predicted ATPase ExeA